MACSSDCLGKNCLNKFGRKILGAQINKPEEPSARYDRIKMDLRRIRACGFDLSISRYDPMATGYEGGFTTSGTLTTSKHLCKTETSRKREKYIRILGKCCTYLSLYDVSYSFFSFLILSSLLP